MKLSSYICQIHIHVWQLDSLDMQGLTLHTKLEVLELLSSLYLSFSVSGKRRLQLYNYTIHFTLKCLKLFSHSKLKLLNAKAQTGDQFNYD